MDKDIFKFLMPLIIVLIVIYAGLFFFSGRGWGYAGYGGVYARSPSFFYFGGAHYYPGEPSARDQSAAGPKHRGGGPKGGK